MAMTVPEYIKRANIAGQPIQYVWPDVGRTPKFLGDERLANRVRAICPRGVVAFSAGCAEWIAWRLSRDFTSSILLDYIEAVRAGIVDWKYLRPRSEVPDAPYLLKDWTGPVRGPIIMTCNGLDQVIRGAKKGRIPGLSSTLLSELALYLMPDERPFKDWRRFAVRRLAEFYPATETAIGPPVPREALDPDVEFDPSLAPEYIERFIKSLDPERNPFLQKADVLLAEGFEGTPYAV